MIRIVADTNDGDYVENTSKISDKELISVKRVVEAIKNFKPYPWTTESFGAHTPKHTHNYPTQEVVREDLGQLSAEDYYVRKGF